MAAISTQLQNLDFPIYHRWEEALSNLATTLINNPTLDQIQQIINKINNYRIDEEPLSGEMAQRLLSDLQFRVTVIEMLEVNIEKYKQIYENAWLMKADPQSCFTTTLLQRRFEDEMIELGTISVNLQSLLQQHPRLLYELERQYIQNPTGDIKGIMDKYREKYYTRSCLAYNSDVTFCAAEAIRHGHMDVLEEALKRELNSDQIKQILNMAIAYDNMKVIKLLLNADNANRVMGMAARRSKPDVISMALDKGANDFDLGMRMAAYNDDMNLVQFMLDKGATDFNSTLTIAIRRKNVDLTQLMLAKGANNFNEGLLVAAEIGNYYMTQLMVRFGATNIREAARISRHYSGFSNITKYLTSIEDFDIEDTEEEAYENLL